MRPGEMFFQKNLDHSTPGWVPRASITHKDRTIQYPLVNDPATLAWLAQIAALEIHVPQWRVDSHGNADAAGPAGAGPRSRARAPGWPSVWRSPSWPGPSCRMWAWTRCR